MGPEPELIMLSKKSGSCFSENILTATSRINRREFLKGVAIAGAIGLHGCSFLNRPRKTNLLLITADTQRPANMSCYGYSRKTTPVADALAAEGAMFTNAYSTSMCTLPAHASLFTGMFPDSHGVINNNRELTVDTPTLAEILQAEGYATAAYLGIWILNQPMGVARGFKHLNWSPKPSSHPVFGIRRSGDYLDDARKFIQDMRSQPAPFFLWLHSFDPHAPYSPPGHFASMFAAPDSPPLNVLELAQGNMENLKGYRPNFPQKRLQSQYDGAIRYLDSNLARLIDDLDATGQLDNTLIVYTADHGENLGENGMYDHTGITQEVIRIPLIMRLPDRLPVRRVTTPVQLPDLTPTILDLLGLPCRLPTGEGESLRPLLQGDVPEDLSRPVFVIDNNYESAAIIDSALSLKIVKKPLYRIMPEAETLFRSGSKLPAAFIDTIIKQDRQWRVAEAGDHLKFSYSGQYRLNQKPAFAELLFATIRGPGNIDIKMLPLALKDDNFSMEYEFPRYHPPNPVNEELPCNFSTTIANYKMKYAVRFLDSSKQPLHTSPWIVCEVTDQNGVKAEPAKGAMHRIISVKGQSCDEWGVRYDPDLNAKELMERLEAFLNRSSPMRIRLAVPLTPPYGGFLLPGVDQNLMMNPEAAFAALLESTHSKDGSEIRAREAEHLRSLGYAG